MKEIFPLSDGRLKSVRDTSRTITAVTFRRPFSPSLSDLASDGIDNHPPPLRDGYVSFLCPRRLKCSKSSSLQLEHD